MSARDQLLVVIDPVARRTDGESVRIAKDVLGAGAGVKLCLPEGPEEFAKALLRRGARRPVVVGDDRALLRAVSILHQERGLGSAVLSVVPVAQAAAAVRLARELGVPAGAVAAARAVLEGVPRRLDLLVDDRDGVVLGDVRIPPVGAGGDGRGTGGGGSAGDGRGAEDGRGAWGGEGGRGPWDGSGGFGGGFGDEAGGRGAAAGERHPWLRTCQSLVRTLGVRPSRVAPGGPSRLRVEADGVTLVDLDQPVEGVYVRPGGGGLARVEVLPASVGAQIAPVRARARSVTVSGPDFRYRADTLVTGPVRTRTWQVRAQAWRLTLPR
ncbi:diacylglycerol kinase [Streptomyces sp. NPDC017941]|uniref:diacylglycerol kinase n=1 Tax=Streptomyces sp. NPDC017941 TaxID=3365018 RepID=UPI0037AC98F9